MCVYIYIFIYICTLGYLGELHDDWIVGKVPIKIFSNNCNKQVKTFAKGWVSALSY